MQIEDTVRRMKQEWSVPHRSPGSDPKLPDFDLACHFSDDPAEPATGKEVPEDLATFWRISSTAKLFADSEFGQWGLEILTPAEAVKSTVVYRSTRARDAETGDLVIGKFLGDSDLLIIRCDSSHADFGSVLVARPINPRHDWYRLASNFGDFLEQFLAASGEKFWEPSQDS